MKWKSAGTPVKSRLPTLKETGDERIELPPKVLETPIIPFDQSPILWRKVTITSHVSLKGSVPSKLHTCYILMESFYLAIAFVEPGHLATTLLSAFCFANVCLPTLSFGNASIPHFTCGDSRSSQLFGQALTRLVAVSCVHCCTSTPALSTSSSSRGFTSFEWDISSWGGLHA